MPNLNRSTPPRDPASGLLHEWVIAGMISAAARFIPVPFVDDMVQTRCRRYVVTRTLRAHDAATDVRELQPYFGDIGGCLAGCAGLMVRAPVKLVLFPIRKVVAVATSIRGVPLEITRTVLLGRTLDRYLREMTQRSTTSDPWRIDRTVAEQLRTAFDRAFAGMDFRFLRAAMKDALNGVAGWKSAATAGAQAVADWARKNRDSMPSMPSGPAIETGANRVEEVLARPEILALFDEFDRRFDQALPDLEAKPPG